jgi:hypothetical protein
MSVDVPQPPTADLSAAERVRAEGLEAERMRN